MPCPVHEKGKGRHHPRFVIPTLGEFAGRIARQLQTGKRIISTFSLACLSIIKQKTLKEREVNTATVTLLFWCPLFMTIHEYPNLILQQAVLYDFILLQEHYNFPK